MVEDHKSPVAQLNVLSVSWDGSGLLGNGRGTESVTGCSRSQSSVPSAASEAFRSGDSELETDKSSSGGLVVVGRLGKLGL